MAKQSIPVSRGGRIELDTGESFSLESPEGQKWLDIIVTDPETGKQKGLSFRYEPMGEYGSFTARNQPVKDVSYWYGSRKIAGEVRKAYIGKLENVTIANLEEVAQKLAEEKPKAVDKKPKAVDKKPKAVDKKPTVVEVSDDRIEGLEAQIRQIQQEMAELRGKLTA